MLTKEELMQELRRIGVKQGMSLEVHSSLKSLGKVDGGADTVINALKETVTELGSIFMPALRLSPEMELDETDRKMGITVKIKVLPSDCKHSAMGIIADTFRKKPDTYTGEGIFRISGWGNHGYDAVTGGLDYVLKNGYALMMGVDIYKLTAMHYVEKYIPKDIGDIFAPNEEVKKAYPEDEWFIETGHPPVKAWYTIQQRAYEKGYIKESMIGKAKVMFFKVSDVVGLYEEALKIDPYTLYGVQ